MPTTEGPSEPKKLSKRAIDALRILRKIAPAHQHQGTTGGPFSRMYWPAAWDAARSTGRRHGLRMRGGSYLSWLVREGYAANAQGDGWNAGYKLSSEGEAFLKALDAVQP